MKALQVLLLDLISTHRPVSSAQLEALAPEQWQRMLAMAIEHRVDVLLYWRLVRERAMTLPATIQQRLASRFHRATLRSLCLQRQLLQLDKTFCDAQIPYLALKGCQLAGLYPHCALRPMRDLDLLFPDDVITRAYQMLLEQGFTHPAGYQKDIPSHLELNKHLPLLTDPSGQVAIELHVRVLDPKVFAEQDFTDDPEFWQRSPSMALTNRTIRVMSPTDLLAHLIIHGCYDHYFNNGPLLFSDVAYLLQHETIDWVGFWQQAEHRQVCQGCLLVLKMVEYYYGEQAIDWPDALSATQLMAIADQAPQFALLTLQDYQQRAKQTGLSLLHHQTSWWGKLNVVWQKLFPPRQLMGLKYPVDPSSNKVWLYYPHHLLRLLAQSPQYYRLSRRPEMDAEARQLAKLKSWLVRSN